MSGIFESQFMMEESVGTELPGVEPLFGGTLADVASIVFGVLMVATLALLVVAGISLVLRLRRATGAERQRVKWFVYTVACVMFAFPVSLLALGQAYGVLLFPLVPVSAAVAILRYRLYDIDVVVNRALVYGTLTATLAGAYVGCVLLLQLVLSPGSDLAVAVSTLAVAALFRPARTRIQDTVDRRFYRRRYDAQRTLEQFSAALRDQVELATLDAALRAVVAETMQPAHVSAWLRTAGPVR